MLLFIIIVLLWWASGITSMVYWWTKDFDLELGEFVSFCFVALPLGPLWYIVCWLWANDESPPKVLFKRSQQ